MSVLRLHPRHEVQSRHGLTTLLLAALALGPSVTNAQAVTLAPRPPVAAPPAFRFPATSSRTLPDGMTLVVSENHALPVVAVYAVVAADSTLDPAGLHGLSNVVKRAMGIASARFPEARLADTLASLGLSMDDTSFTTRTANFAPALGIMADLLAHPTFSEATIANAKSTVLQSRRAADNSTVIRAHEMLYDVLFGPTHPYTNRASVASVGAIAVRDAEQFHAAWYRPSRVTLIVVGDVTVAEAERQATRAFAGWTAPSSNESGTPSPLTMPLRDTAAGTTVYLLDRPGSRQSGILLGALGPDLASASAPAVTALDAEIGGTGSARLPRALRQEHAWAYTAISRVDTRGLEQPIVLWAAADVATAATDSAIVVAMARLRAMAVPDSAAESDLAAARAGVTGFVQRFSATDDGLAARIESLVRYHLPLDYFTELAGRLDRLSTTQVAEAAARYDNPDRMIVVVVGDRASIEGPIRALGLPVVLVP